MGLVFFGGFIDCNNIWEKESIKPKQLDFSRMKRMGCIAILRNRSKEYICFAK